MTNPSELQNDIRSLLSSTSTKELLLSVPSIRSQLSKSSLTLHAPEHPICLDADLPVQEACAALAKHKISSAPIYDSKQGGFVGMLDYRDIVAYVLTVFHKVPQEKASVDADMEIKDVVKLALQQGHGNVPVKLLSNLSYADPLVVVNSDSPLLDAVEEFVRARVHRCVILDKSSDGKPTFLGILSQSSVAALVASKFGKLSGSRLPGALWEQGNKTIEELGLVKKDVVGISPDDPVIEALYHMHEKHISSIAIIRRTPSGNELYGSISLTDIKDILSRRGGWSRLMQPSGQFFVQLRNDQVLANKGHDAMPSFSIHPSTLLITAVEKMAATHVHRMWIVDPSLGGNNVVVGILSLSDVMPLLLKA